RWPRDWSSDVCSSDLGSMSDAEDAVQDTWLRLSRADTSRVENLTGWLTTVVARVSLDMLRSRTSRREEQFGDSVPEPPDSHEERSEERRVGKEWRHSR